MSDEPMQGKLKDLLTFIQDSQTAFGLEIQYHPKWWCGYFSIPLKKSLCDKNAEHLQQINFLEAQVTFFQHVRQVIFEEQKFVLYRDY